MTGRTGSRADSAIQNSDLWIVKVNRDGGLEWQRGYDLFGHDGRDEGKSIIETDDGGFLVGGNSRVQGSPIDFIAIKVDEQGNLVWQRGYGNGINSNCNAVIETKGDVYLLGGTIDGEDGYQAFAVMVDRNGEILWQRRYDRQQSSCINAIRESPGSGFLLAGSQIGAFSLLKIDDEGDVIWSQIYDLGENYTGTATNLVSTPDGFALAGYAVWRNDNMGDFYMVRVDEDGEVIWENRFEMEGDQLCYGMDRMWDGGFFLDGVGDRHGRQLMMRVSPGGEVIWSMNVNLRSLDLFSCIVDHEMYLLVCGSCRDPEGEREDQGILMKYIPEHSPPEIIDYSPEELELYALPGTEIEFFVEATDLQDDSLSYQWIWNDEVVSTEQTANILFENIADHNVWCSVSDGALTTEIRWLVHVMEFYLESHTPDTLNLTVQRNTDVSFILDAEAIEGLDLSYEWTQIDRNQRQQIVGHDDTLDISFDLPGNNNIRGEVFNEETRFEVNWEVDVRSLVWWWFPHENDLTIEEDTTLRFVITPFDEEADSLVTCLWYKNDEELGEGLEYEIEFSNTGEYQINAFVSVGEEADTVRWNVEVQERSFTAGCTPI